MKWILCLLLTGCAAGHCRSQYVDASERTIASEESLRKNFSSGRVKVYKPDGSRQCGEGKAISPEEMEKELGSIRVYSRSKGTDGKMHASVCGGDTGNVNIYEISDVDRPRAEKLKFILLKEI